MDAIGFFAEGAKLGIELAGTLTAAFGGAYLAFNLATKREKDRLYEERFGSLQFAIYMLLRKKAFAKPISTHIEDYREDLFRHINMWPSEISSSAPSAVQDMHSLTFMMEHPKLRDAFLYISAVEDCYFQLLSALKARNLVHVEEFQPVLVAEHMDEEHAYDASTVNDSLEIGMRTRMEALTDVLLHWESQTLRLIDVALEKLKESTNETFPKLIFDWDIDMNHDPAASLHR